MGKEVTLSQVKAFHPDVVVVATGAVPFLPLIPGMNEPIVATSCDILSSKRKPGKKSVVIGGKREGLVAAEFLAEKGSEVTVVEASNSLGSDWGPVRQMVILARIQENPAISIKLKTNVEQINGSEVFLQSEGRTERVTGIDSVVVAWNRAPANRLADEMIADGQVPEIYCVGDALIPRDAYDAIYEGAVVGRRI